MGEYKPRISSLVPQTGLKWVGGMIKFMPDDNSINSEAFARYIDLRGVSLSMFVRFPKLAPSVKTQFAIRVIYRSGGSVSFFNQINRSERIIWSWEQPTDDNDIVGVTMPQSLYDLGELLPVRSVDLFVVSEQVQDNHDWVVWNKNDVNCKMKLSILSPSG